MADAFGTPGGVVSAKDHRLDQGGLLAVSGSTTLDVRTGVLWGPGTTALVTGTSATGTMTVSIAPHHAVTTRGAGDGVYLGPTLESSTTVNIAAAPGSNSRIDVVYAKQADTAATVSPDGATAPVYGVVAGTASATPTKPSLSSVVGAVEIATVQVAAGATSTNGAGVTITNTALQTVARGAPIPVRNQTERDALTTYPLLTVKRLDTGRWEQRNFGNTAWENVYAPAASWVNLTPATNWSTYTGSGGVVTSGPFETFGYRLEGNRVFLRGWLTTAALIPAGGAISTALPTALRPAKGQTIWPAFEVGGNQGSTVRCEVFTNGIIYTNRGVASGLFFNFDGLSYAI